MLREEVFDTGNALLNFAECNAEGIPLVLLPGITVRWQNFLPVLPALSLRYHTYVIDSRGHGRSKSSVNSYRNEDFVEDTIRFITGKVKEPVVLLGHSHGVAVAFAVAAQAPEWVRAVIAEDPGPSPYLWAAWTNGPLQDHPLAQIFRQLDEAMRRNPSPDELKITVRAMLPKADALTLRSIANTWSQVNPTVVAQLVEGKTYEHFVPDDLLPRITCPVLLVVGNTELGGQVDDDLAARIQGLITDCICIRRADAGHVVHTSQPVAFTQLVNDFVESL
jgi:pimeloyl-ACP methyl ester carboxylesterase